jgi:hypothetical protein
MKKQTLALQCYDQGTLSAIETIAVLAEDLTPDTIDDTLALVGDRIGLLTEFLHCAREWRAHGRWLTSTGLIYPLTLLSQIALHKMAGRVN